MAYSGWTAPVGLPGLERISARVRGCHGRGVPGQRGHGYATDLLNEITRIHARHGARHIDADKTPMVDAFRRARYANFAIRIIHSAS
ncbi:hypothetical protein [Nonomuraea jabiensis]|uniref:hypothetical protein n=1 Tax=Nonomuraea jabiensis TaxID=882448 RepID=UPI003D70B43B